MMKILYDYQTFSSFAYSGISRYFCELFQEFRALHIDWEVGCRFSNNRYLQKLYPLPGFFPQWNFRGKNRILELINRHRTFQCLADNDFSIFHSTYSKPYTKAELRGKPYVITVHDLTHEKYLEKLPSGVRETAEEKESIYNADAILCPSQATRADLIAFYPEAESKISVIYHGVRIPDFTPGKFATRSPYFIYVGSRYFFRNFPTAVQAVAQLPSTVKLLCVGGGSFSAKEWTLFRKYHLEDRIFHRQLSEEDLFSAYSGAAGLIFPSEAEGFGLPIIEAQSQGCVPVLADTPCFREIGGNAALYFPVKNINAAAEQLEKLLPNSRESLHFGSAEMIHNLQKFQWKTAAKQTLAVYQSLL